MIAVFEAVTAYLNVSRGVPWMFGLFVGLVVAMHECVQAYQTGMLNHGRRRQSGGGAPSPASTCPSTDTSAFALCATFAAAGGVLAAARLAGASQQAGTGDVNLNAIASAVIGGTSPSAAAGSAYSSSALASSSSSPSQAA